MGSWRGVRPSRRQIFTGIAWALACSAAACTLTAGMAAGAGALPRVSVSIVAAPAPAPAASSAMLAAPTTSALRAAAGAPAAAIVTRDMGRRFDMIGALFHIAGGTARDVALRLRVGADRLHWSRWVTLRADGSGPAGSVQGKADFVTEPVWVGSGRFIQYEVTTAGAASMSHLRFACLDSQVTTPVAAPLAAPAAATLAEGMRLGMPVRPTIVTRAQWGADESLRSGSPNYGEVRCAFVHHTVNANGYTRKQAPALVRGIYAYHTRVNGWSDIGYNFLIDRFGTIYEGRYGGMSKAVIGAQVLGFNSWSTGVSMIGTYSSVTPSAVALDSLERLLSWKLDLSHLDPLGTARIQCSTPEIYRAGQWVTVPVIVGHRQVNYTECPGNALANLLPAIRTAVDGVGNPKIYTPIATPAAFSPNGDGRSDTVTLRCRLSEASDWTATVSDTAGTNVASFSGSGTSVAAVWDGHVGAGARAPDGAYTATFAASSANGTARAARVAVRLDTIRPSLTGLSITPLISPNGDGIVDKARGSAVCGESCRWRVRVLDGSGVVVRTVFRWTPVAAGKRSFVWDGKVVSGAQLAAAPDGDYEVRVDVTDAAGNMSSVKTNVAVDSSLGFPKASPAWVSPNGDGVNDQTQLSFRLARSAKVSIDIASPSAAIVRHLALGTLAAGSHQAPWDARDGNGALVANGAYTCTVKAVNAIGTVTVPLIVHIDKVHPTVVWSSGARGVTLGKTLHAGFTVTDPFSSRADVTIVVMAADGRVVASPSPFRVTTGAVRVWAYRPRSRGVYSVVLRAVDRAGNHELATATMRLNVK